MQLISVRTNTRFAVDYSKVELKPQIEVIILTTNPKYKFKGDDIERDTAIKELRFETTLKGINALIGELQATVQGLNTFDQMASGINAMIKAAKPEEKGEKKDE